MKEALQSPSIRSGNVLALLDTLYTSGFAMGSPSTPMLKGRTMHTLYALSFIVYVLNCIADWVHIVASLRGEVTSFVMDTWLAVSLVTVSVAGSMMTWLLLVLCVENAFAHRLDVTPYRSGCALIWESIVEWIQAFNNFRVAFLMMVLHDAPITVINFFFLTSCRCPGPNVVPWTLLFSSVTTTFSLFWRFTMLHFAYRRMLFPVKKQSATVQINRQPSALKHMRQLADIREDPRLTEYDECFPIRWAKMKIFGQPPPETPEVPRDFRQVPAILTLPCIGYCASLSIKSVTIAKRTIMWIGCSILSIFGYFMMFGTCCIPYCYHYTCRKNSFYHRHKCARSFVRYFSCLFHIVTFVFSCVVCSSLIILNLTLISSVHVIGSNSAPPELDRVCVSVLPLSKTVRAAVLPEQFFSTAPLADIVNRQLAEEDKYATTFCKPLWEDGGLGMGIKRLPAGPWQIRTKFQSFLLAVATQAVIDNSNPKAAHITVYFDLAELSLRDGRDETETCRRGNETSWIFLAADPELPPPYFLGCKKDIRFVQSALIECFKTATTRATTPVQGWQRRKIHKTRHGNRQP